MADEIRDEDVAGLAEATSYADALNAYKAAGVPYKTAQQRASARFPGRRKSPTGDRPPAPDGAAAAPRGGRRKSSRRGGAGRVREKARGLMGAAAALVMLRGDLVTAERLSGAPGMATADAWGRLAEEDVRVRRVIERLSAGGVYGQVTVATLVLLAPIAASYGLIPDPARTMILRATPSLDALAFGSVIDVPPTPPAPAPAPPPEASEGSPGGFDPTKTGAAIRPAGAPAVAVA